MAGFATLLFDLLTLPRRRSAQYLRCRVADPAPRGRHQVAARSGSDRWIAACYIGASTGGAAALSAAAEPGAKIGAIVLRDGRTDLAESRLAEVAAPTLLIVGSNDW